MVVKRFCKSRISNFLATLHHDRTALNLRRAGSFSIFPLLRGFLGYQKNLLQDTRVWKNLFYSQQEWSKETAEEGRVVEERDMSCWRRRKGWKGRGWITTTKKCPLNHQIGFWNRWFRSKKLEDLPRL